MNHESTEPCCGPDCCNETPGAAAGDQDQIRDTVRAGYAEIARSGQWSGVDSAAAADAAETTGCGDDGGGGGCCGSTTLSPEHVALAVGYASSDLTILPDGANMGLSCGNPIALASLNAGDVVVDLGSGGGFDCFIAGPKVGARGRVIGVDMTPEMLSKARGNLATYHEQSGLDNVEFRLGEIEHLPVGDGQADVVISNCVINLSPDKAQVWREIARILRPGGRVSVSDLALLEPLPSTVRRDLEALVGCVAGAQLVDEIRSNLDAAGLVDVQLTAKPQYIDAMVSWQDPLYQRIAASLPAGASMGDYIVSLDIEARKPSRR